MTKIGTFEKNPIKFFSGSKLCNFFFRAIRPPAFLNGLSLMLLDGSYRALRYRLCRSAGDPNSLHGLTIQVKGGHILTPRFSHSKFRSKPLTGWPGKVIRGEALQM